MEDGERHLNSVCSTLDYSKSEVPSEVNSSATICGKAANDEQVPPCDTIIVIDGDMVMVTAKLKCTAVDMSATHSIMECDNIGGIDRKSTSDVCGDNTSSSEPPSLKNTIGTQTNMSGYDVEVKQSRSRNPSGETTTVRLSDSPFGRRTDSPFQPFMFRAKSPPLGGEQLGSRQSESMVIETLQPASVVDSEKKDLNTELSPDSTINDSSHTINLNKCDSSQLMPSLEKLSALYTERLGVDTKSCQANLSESNKPLSKLGSVGQEFPENGFVAFCLENDSSSAITSGEIDKNCDNEVRMCNIGIQNLTKKEEEMFEFELSGDEVNDNRKRKQNCSEGGENDQLLSSELSRSLGDGTTVASGVEQKVNMTTDVHSKHPDCEMTCDYLTEDWSGSQFAATFHPFSDTDITPVTR